MGELVRSCSVVLNNLSLILPVRGIITGVKERRRGLDTKWVVSLNTRILGKHRRLTRSLLF